MDPTPPAAGRPRRARARVRRRRPASPSSPSTPRPSCCCATGTASRAGWRCTCCAGTSTWRSPRACACSPAAASTSATSTPTSAGSDRPPRSGRALLGCDEAFARALVCAAVRETFEESGVLLAGPHRGLGRRRHHRRRLGGGPPRPRGPRGVLHRRSWTRRGLELRTDLLRLWGSWVTPVFEPRRFNARFFVAELPAGQVTRDVSTESDHVVWLPVRRGDPGGRRRTRC